MVLANFSNERYKEIVEQDYSMVAQEETTLCRLYL